MTVHIDNAGVVTGVPKNKVFLSLQGLDPKEGTGTQVTCSNIAIGKGTLISGAIRISVKDGQAVDS
jgi:hypothetical protein